MPDYAPVSLQAIDENGQKLIDASVPFSLGMDVQQVMEAAFVVAQKTATPDPFLYTVEFYGYSEVAAFPGYLGYEIESIGTKATGLKPSNSQFYWKLSLNGIDSNTGADTTFPGPGSIVLWIYTPIPQSPAQLPPRTKVVQDRRAARAAGSPK